MFGQVSIPWWLFLLLTALALLAVLDRLFVPGVRWFWRRKVNRVLDEIGARLSIDIRPFQLTKRQVLIDRLVNDPLVLRALNQASRETFTPRELLEAEVQAYAREIVPSFNAYLYFRLGYWIAKKIARLLYRVRAGRVDNERLGTVDPDSTVVFVMNHRSNMDYILVAFLAAERTTLSYAVGEWARIWPLQTLIRAMGAFFVRRNSGNPLYRLVLERYIRMATREGVCQAVFLEGGLSRDGRMRPPRFGLIDYMLRGFDHERDRDVVFIPVGLNYDRVLEDRSLLRSLDPEARKRSLFFILKTTLGFILHNLGLMAVKKWRRFGYACVNFGDPFSMREYCRRENINFSRLSLSERHVEVERLCRTLAAGTQAVIPALPVALVSAVMLENRSRPRTPLEIKARTLALVERLEEKGAQVFRPYRGLEVALEEGLDMLRLRKLVRVEDGLVLADPAMTGVLTYYANSIGHWSAPPAPQPGTP
ncbi:MAG: 1-acyl-sn-glycerol-3-phosphate acyltransferase [Thermodesulfobacteriota bacterium]